MPLPTRVFGRCVVPFDHFGALVHHGKNFLICGFHITSGLVCWLLPRLVAFQAVIRQAVE